MRILIALTYYRPHYSGLTIYVERLARALAARGHQVTVLTSRYEPSLPAYEFNDGVEIYRLKVLLQVSKGVLMPEMPLRAWKLAQQADVVNPHVPQLDAAVLSVFGRLLGKPVVLTYHCDLQLPKGRIHYVANRVSHLANHVSAAVANLIVTNTQDYAEHSRFLRRYLDKIRVIPPPVVLPEVGDAELNAFRKKAKVEQGQLIIGMAARLATEKGVEYLVQAMPEVLKMHPGARVLFVGQHRDVLGEEAYASKLAPLIQELGDHWTFLGVLPPMEFAAFLRCAEVTVLPSINSTESFGMVQIESMSSGTPVVATDLPGVRQPVLASGMGQVVPVADAGALAQAINTILDEPQNYRGDSAGIARRYSPEVISGEYESLFERLLEKSG